jgi:hypothetical protein
VTVDAVAVTIAAATVVMVVASGGGFGEQDIAAATPSLSNKHGSWVP